MTARRALALVALAAGCAPHEAAITNLHVSVTWDATKTTIDQLRFELTDAGTPVGKPALEPMAPGAPLDSGADVAILLADVEAGRTVHVKVTGMHAGMDVDSGEADAMPELGARKNVTVALGATGAQSLEVQPSPLKLAKGASKQLMAIAHFPSGTMDVAASAQWSSSDTSIVDVGATGLAVGKAPGMATVTAVYGNVMGAAMVTVGAADLVSINVSPSNKAVPVGTTLQLTATGAYTDASNADLTSMVAWSSSDPNVASVDAKGLVKGVMQSGQGQTITATLGGIMGSTTVTVTGAQLTAISVTPPNASMAVSSSKPFFATGLFSDNSTQDLTSSVTWTTLDATVATVSNMGQKGVVSALKAGATKVIATSGNVAGSAMVTVTAATLVSIAVTPSGATMAKGTSQPYTAVGTYSDKTTQDLTTQVAWSTSDPNVATVSNAKGTQGLVAAAGAGMATISATDPMSMVKGSTPVTVSAATLQSITVTPAAPMLAKGTTQQLTATGTFSDNTTQDLTNTVTWSSSDMNVATVSNGKGSQGLATAAGAGMATVTAIDPNSMVKGSTPITVSAATLSSIAVSPATASIGKGSSQQFVATGTYSDMSTQDLTTMVTWSSSDMNVATISNAPGSQGLASSGNPGNATITAALGMKSGAAMLTVTAATLSSITIAPANASVAAGSAVQYAATGHYSDMSTQDVTTMVTWGTSDGTVATISNAMGTQGKASTLKAGSINVTATLGNVTGTTGLTVTAATLTSIAVTPANATVVKGTTLQFTATGTYSDNSKQDVTAQATWASSNGAVISISNANGTQGQATGVAVGGPVTISATLSGKAGTTSASCTNPTLTSIAVSPVNATISHLGGKQQYTATGHYSDNTTQDLTLSVTWNSSNQNAATISNGGNLQPPKGTASAQLGGQGQQTTITVSCPMNVTCTPGALTIN